MFDTCQQSGDEVKGIHACSQETLENPKFDACNASQSIIRYSLVISRTLTGVPENDV